MSYKRSRRAAGSDARYARPIELDSNDSREPTPSPDDVALTAALVEAGSLLEIDVLDHVVFGHGRYVSMREQRLGFE